jgi:hypothetical protein
MFVFVFRDVLSRADRRHKTKVEKGWQIYPGTRRGTHAMAVPATSGMTRRFITGKGAFVTWARMIFVCWVCLLKGGHVKREWMRKEKSHTAIWPKTRPIVVMKRMAWECSTVLPGELSHRYESTLSVPSGPSWASALAKDRSLPVVRVAVHTL